MDIFRNGSVGERSVTSVVAKVRVSLQLYTDVSIDSVYLATSLFAAKIRPRWSSSSVGFAPTCDELQIHSRHTRCFIIAPKPSLYSAFLSTGLRRLSVKIDHQKATPQDSSRANDGCLLRYNVVAAYTIMDQIASYINVVIALQLLQNIEL